MWLVHCTPSRLWSSNELLVFLKKTKKLQIVSIKRIQKEWQVLLSVVVFLYRMWIIHFSTFTIQGYVEGFFYTFSHFTAKWSENSSRTWIFSSCLVKFFVELSTASIIHWDCCRKIGTYNLYKSTVDTKMFWNVFKNKNLRDIFGHAHTCYSYTFESNS